MQNVTGSDAELRNQRRKDLTPVGAKLHNQRRKDLTPVGAKIHNQRRKDLTPVGGVSTSSTNNWLSLNLVDGPKH